MTLSFRFLRALPALAVVLACAGTAYAEPATPKPKAQTTLPRAQTALPRISTSGSYLAARHAGTNRDTAAAAIYYRAALRGDPRNPELLNRAFTAVLQNGDIDEAVRLAERLLQVDRNDRLARFVLGVRAIKQKQYATARTQLSQSMKGPVTDLAATLLIAWTHASPNESKTAIETIDKLAGPDSYALLKDLHAGLILDVSGNRKEALKRLERAYKADPTVLRVVQSYASVLARLGNREDAFKAYRAFNEALPRHPLVADVLANADNAKQRLPQIVDTPQAGAAEALRSGGAARRSA